MTAAADTIEVQLAGDDDEPPQPERIRAWAAAALAAVDRPGAALTVRVVGREEACSLNRDFRGRDYATNVLSFPFSEIPPEAMIEIGAPYLGDIAICADVVAREAEEQGKPACMHWAHMVVHGVLHLAGFDHEEAAAAERMEERERGILAGLGFPDPYADGEPAVSPPAEKGESR